MKTKTKTNKFTRPLTAFEMAMAADSIPDRLAAFAKRICELDKQIAARAEEREDLRKQVIPLLDKKITVAGRFKLMLSHIRGGHVSYYRKPYDSLRVKKLRRLRTRTGLVLALLCCALSANAQRIKSHGVLRDDPGRTGSIAVQRLPYATYGTPIEAVPNYGPDYVHDGRWLAASTNLMRLEASLRSHIEELGILSRIMTPTPEQAIRRQQLTIWIRNQENAKQPLHNAMKSVEAEYELKRFKQKVRPQ